MRAAAARACARQRRRRLRADTTHGTTAPSLDRRHRPRQRRSGSGACSEDHVRVGAADAERRDTRPGAAALRLRPLHAPRSAAPPRPPTSPRAATARPTCSVRGSTPCRIASTILITPATPAAACVCPMFDFTEPSHSGRSVGPVLPVRRQQRLRLDRVAQRRARAVRLHHVHSDGDSPALASACRITRCCDGPFGAVSPFDAPSWFTARPAHHRQHLVPVAPRVRQPLHAAARRRPRPSRCRPRAAANALHRPSGASPPCRLNSTKAPGVAITVTPPASAR